MLPGQKGKTGVTEKKSIYDYVSGEMDVTKEVHKLADLFEIYALIQVHNTHTTNKKIPLERYVSRFFLKWNGRGSYLTPEELKQDMGVADIKNKIPNELQTTLYLEYLLNMIELFEDKEPSYKHQLHKYQPYKYQSQKHQSISIGTSLYQALKDNLSLLLSQLNLKPVQKEQGVFILVPENPEVTEAVDIVEKSDVKLAILEYNHITNRENLAEKQKILHVLAKDFEPRRLELGQTKEGKTLASDLGFLFNTLDIRHNNTEGIKAIPAIQNMPKTTLLEWYDITYRTYLTAVLLHDYSSEEQQAKITALKKAVNPT